MKTYKITVKLTKEGKPETKEIEFQSKDSKDTLARFFKEAFNVSFDSGNDDIWINIEEVKEKTS